MVHPTQILYLKVEILGISVKVPPLPQPCSGVCCTAEGISGHRKERFRCSASLLAERAEGNALGAQKTGDICHHCQFCRFAAVLLEETGCSRRELVDGSALPKLGWCPCQSPGEMCSEELRDSSSVPDLLPASTWQAVIQTVSGRVQMPSQHTPIRRDCRSSSFTDGCPYSLNWTEPK